jgi:hypothetical protein
MRKGVQMKHIKLRTAQGRERYILTNHEDITLPPQKRKRKEKFLPLHTKLPMNRIKDTAAYTSSKRDFDL